MQDLRASARLRENENLFIHAPLESRKPGDANFDHFRKCSVKLLARGFAKD